MRGQLKVVNLLTCVISVTCVTCEDAAKTFLGERSVRGQLGSVQSPFQRGGGDDPTVQVEQIDLKIPLGTCSKMFQGWNKNISHPLHAGDYLAVRMKFTHIASSQNLR